MHPSNKVKNNIEEVFSYHAPTKIQQAKYEEIRAYAKTFAKLIVDSTPECADQSTALRKLRETVMYTNAAIALEKGIVND